MRAAQFRRYGAAREVLEIVEEETLLEPGPSELLVRVHASSVNPIDCAVRQGYGREYFEARGLSRWPNRPGRDVAGEVVAVGESTVRLHPGDRIYAATLGGANADYLLLPEEWAARMPESLTFLQAASIPYSALTSWSALVTRAGLSPTTTAGKRVLIPRAAGGVGSFAVQLVKAWGGYVAASCSTRNLQLVKELGADEVIDYTLEEHSVPLRDFDVAFDTSFNTEALLLDALKRDSGAVYVSIVSPRLRLIDDHGLEEGLRRGDALLAERTAAQRALGRAYHWSFAQPNGAALATIATLVDAGKVRPNVDQIFPLEQIADAHERSEAGLARGRILIDLDQRPQPERARATLVQRRRA